MDNVPYNVEDIALVEWPQLEPLPNGLWQRIWRITFKEEIKIEVPEASSTLLADLLSEEDWAVTLSAIHPRGIEVTVVTREWGWADKFYAATYRMLKKIEEQLGTIDTIQGQPKTLWLPWRFPQLRFEDIGTPNAKM